MKSELPAGIDGGLLAGSGIQSFARRAFLGASGRSISRTRQPVIGICTSWSELNPCNGNLRSLAESVKRGVQAAGGQAFEFPTISLAEQFISPTSMILRNLMAMDVEEMIRRSPIDAVVLLAGCDKTVPAQLMGAVSAGRPAIMLTSGPRNTGRFCGEPVVTDDFWSLAARRSIGEISDQDWNELEQALCPSVGVCNVLGTAVTMSAMAEALGFSLPGSSLIAATDARRSHLAEATGRRAVELATAGPPASDMITEASLDNALRLLTAIGGSTNAVIHLEALAGRVGLTLGVDRIVTVAATTPLLTAVRPSGPYLLEDLQSCGGFPAVLKQLGSVLEREALTATGETLGTILTAQSANTGDVLRPFDDPVEKAGGITAIRGNLAPRGAIIKRSAADDSLLSHEGPALVFDSLDDAKRAAADPGLKCPADSVLVVRNCGPIGGPGMPELGQIPIPATLRKRGVTDMVCVTDGRVSGTQKGTTALHAVPESVAGGILSVVRTGDPIRLSTRTGRLDLLVDDNEIHDRTAENVATVPAPSRGYSRLYHEHVLQADEGCDFDFLRGEKVQ